MVTMTLATWCRFQMGSRRTLANRKTSRFCTGSLPRKQIDPEDLVLVEVAEDLVELDGAGEIAPERFLDNEAAIGGEPGLGEGVATSSNSDGGSP